MHVCLIKPGSVTSSVIVIPPIELHCSITTTPNPAFAREHAHVKPLCPAPPITIASYSGKAASCDDEDIKTTIGKYTMRMLSSLPQEQLGECTAQRSMLDKL